MRLGLTNRIIDDSDSKPADFDVNGPDSNLIVATSKSDSWNRIIKVDSNPIYNEFKLELD